MTGEEQMYKTLERQDMYNTLVKRKLILVAKDLLAKYPFNTTRFTRLYGNDENMRDNIVEKFGLTDRFFGGNIAKAAQVKDSAYVVLADAEDNTIGILIPDENLPLLTIEQLKDLLVLFNIAIPKEYKKQDLINLLSERHIDKSKEG